MVGQDREAGSNGAITSSSISTKSTRAATSRRGKSRNSSAPRSGRPSDLCAEGLIALAVAVRADEPSLKSGEEVGFRRRGSPHSPNSMLGAKRPRPSGKFSRRTNGETSSHDLDSSDGCSLRVHHHGSNRGRGARAGRRRTAHDPAAPGEDYCRSALGRTTLPRNDLYPLSCPASPDGTGLLPKCPPCVAP